MGNNKKTNSAFSSFLMHLHPKKVDEQAIKYSRTFGLGGMSALLFFILAFTGLLLRFSYVPTPENAYDSIMSLRNNSVIGPLLLNIHHWSANLMIITVFLHLLRVFNSQSIYYERAKNWYYGLVLFFIVLAFNFTGYLLPWDQLSFWAVSIMTNIIEYIPFIGDALANTIRGGETVNGNTLLNFYNFHTSLLPLLFFIFMMLHFWLIRKAKGVTVADAEQKNMVNVNPELIYKEIVVALGLIAFIITISMFFDVQLLDKANPMHSPNPSKAPWYFMGIQELLINLHPIFVSLIIPMSLFLFLFYIPKLQIDKSKIGHWFYSQNGKSIILFSTVYAVIINLILIFVLEHNSHFNELDLPIFISTGIIPLMMFLIPTIIFIFVLKKNKNADNAELIIAVMTIILSSYIIMSIVGIFFRGEGMHLIF